MKVKMVTSRLKWGPFILSENLMKMRISKCYPMCLMTLSYFRTCLKTGVTHLLIEFISECFGPEGQCADRDKHVIPGIKMSLSRYVH